jgi:Na+-translocating ferredoxin:NAD+ oxidoreductase subunit B
VEKAFPSVAESNNKLYSYDFVTHLTGKETSMEKGNAYERLIAHLGEWYMGLPEAEVLLPLIKVRYTEEEASFLADFPFLPQTLDDLADRYPETIEALATKLEALAEKGLIFESLSGRSVRYALNDSMFALYRSPFWGGKDDATIQKLSRLANQYYDQGYGQEFGAYPTMGLRAIPIGQTVTDTRHILPFEDIAQVVAQEVYFCTSHCPCRQRKKLDVEAETCKHETFNCIHFGRLARYMVNQGMGKEITREETMEILKQAAEAGLVHGISNTREGMDTICNCCSCCCLFLESKHKLHLHGHQPSNYILSVKASTCLACGLCVKRCPMKALELAGSEGAQNEKGQAPRLETEACIGCGVCVYKCPSGSLGLIQRPEQQDFPKNFREQVYRMGKERGRILF